MNTVERRIVGRLVDAGLSMGYSVSVNDGEEWTVKRSSNRKEIMDALATTDSDTLRFHTSGGDRVGGFFLVWGNDEDVISDHSDNEACEALFKKAVYG